MIGLLTLASAIAAGHPVHETHADAAFDGPDARALELSVRFDPADLRDGLAAWSGLDIDPADPTSERLIGAYLEWHLRTLNADEDHTHHDFVGTERDDAWIWAHVALRLPTNTDTITVRNTLCFDTNPTQTNHLTIRSEDFVQTLVFTAETDTAPLDIPRQTRDNDVTPH